MEIAQVKDVMTDNAVTATPEMPILETARLISEHHFSGVPVIDKAGKLVGLVTEYNLINEQGLLSSPTLENIARMPQKIENIIALKTADVMDTTPLTLYFDDTFEDAVKLFNDHHSVNPVPVIDHENKLVGVLSRYDLIKLLKIYGHS